MEQQRNILFILFLVLSLFLYWSWESDKINATRIAEAQAQEELITASTASSSIANVITLQNDTLKLTIDLNGGDIVDAKLLKVAQEQGKADPFHLMMTKSNFTYQAQSGLAGKDGIDTKIRPLYTADKTEYIQENGRDTVSATLKYEKDNVIYTKTFTLNTGSYVVDIQYDVQNNSEQDLSMAFYGQLKQTADISDLQNTPGFMVAGAYRGSAYSSDDTRYEKNTFETLIDLKNDKQNVNVNTKNGWVAMIQHYFVSAWVVPSSVQNIDHVIYSNASSNNKDAIIGLRTNSTNIKAKTNHTFNAQMWIGPKDQKAMETLSRNLELTVDYGWLWFISIPLFKLLQFIHGIVGNWGFSIIVLTLIVRGILFPLTKAQYTSMAKMRLLTPKMQELRERYKDDRQKLGQETMRLYKTEKVNPLGGCFPLVIQMPIFIALYWMLMESVDLRHAPFIFWIKDLSVYDPFFVTPILYGISMFMIQKMSPTPVNDPVQRKVIMAMPLIFTFMFCTFPAGLTIYWLVSNIFTIFQQIIIFKQLEKKGLHVKEAK